MARRIRKQLKFEVVVCDDGEGDEYCVKTQLRKGGAWYTAATAFCIPGRLDCEEMAKFICDQLNEREKRLAKKK